MKWPWVIILSGPPAVGKNSIARCLCMEYHLKVADIDLDVVKKYIPNAPSTDYYLDIASEVGQAIMLKYLKKRISVVVHKAFCSFEYVKPFINICNSLKIDYKYFKLSAPLNILISRNISRDNSSSEDNLRRVYDYSISCAHPQGIFIDTDKYTIKESVNRIKMYIE